MYIFQKLLLSHRRKIHFDISGTGKSIAILGSSTVGTESLKGKVFLTTNITWQASKYERQSVVIFAAQK